MPTPDISRDQDGRADGEPDEYRLNDIKKRIAHGNRDQRLPADLPCDHHADQAAEKQQQALHRSRSCEADQFS